MPEIAAAAKIRRLLPRLMELSFGCEVEAKRLSLYGDKLKRGIVHCASTDSRSGQCLKTGSILCWHENEEELVRIEYGEYNTIGHPITKENVEEAIEMHIDNAFSRISFDDILVPFEDFGMKIGRRKMRNFDEWSFSFNGYSQSAREYPREIAMDVLLNGFFIQLKRLWQYGTAFNEQPKEVHEFVADIFYSKKMNQSNMQKSKAENKHAQSS